MEPVGESILSKGGLRCDPSPFGTTNEAGQGSATRQRRRGISFKGKAFWDFVFLCVPKKLRIFSFIMQIENIEFPRLSTEASCIISR